MQQDRHRVRGRDPLLLAFRREPRSATPRALDSPSGTLEPIQSASLALWCVSWVVERSLLRHLQTGLSGVALGLSLEPWIRQAFAQMTRQ